MNTLNERLQRVDARAQAIVQAAARHEQLPQQQEEWWPSLIQFFDGEDVMFDTLRINRDCFEDALVLVNNVALNTRGRKGAIRTHREKLFS